MVSVVGKDPQAVYRVTCRHCAAILEYTKSEMKRYEGRDWSGGSDGREWINCPSCGNEVTIRAW